VVRGATILVSAGESIQAALQSASPGDDVLVAPGTYFETLSLVDGVNLKAQTPGTAIVDAEAEGSVVQAHQIGSNTLVEGMTFRNGSANQGGGLFAIGSSTRFVNCRFESNGAALGGGASLTQGSTMSFDACTFTHNSAAVGGGIHLDFSNATIKNSFVTLNQAQSDGAAMAIQNGSQALIQNNCIYANHALEGAIISIIYSSPTVVNCTITANQDDAGGGTLAALGSLARIERCIVAFNSGPALRCSVNGNPQVACNDFFGNADDSFCGTDLGDNLAVDPLFCNAAQSMFSVQANSPVLGTVCGDLGAHITTCPTLTTVEVASWSHVKLLYGR
jgi:hypothetical protein